MHVLESTRLLILNARRTKERANASQVMSPRTLFLVQLTRAYKHCCSPLKVHFEPFILCILYHLFGDALRSESNRKEKVPTVLHQCLRELREICVDSLASRMLTAHRLDILNVIRMALLFEGHAWLKGDSESMSETRPTWSCAADTDHDHDASLCLEVVGTPLGVFEQLLSIVVSEDEAIDASVATFSAQTMHAVQQSIHAAVRAALFRERAQGSRVRKVNDDAFERQAREKEQQQMSDKSKLSAGREGESRGDDGRGAAAVGGVDRQRHSQRGHIAVAVARGVRTGAVSQLRSAHFCRRDRQTSTSHAFDVVCVTVVSFIIVNIFIAVMYV